MGYIAVSDKEEEEKIIFHKQHHINKSMK